MTEADIRNVVVAMAQSWIGRNEKDGSFWPIIDLYNRQRPLPRGYTLNDKDEWCAAFVSAVGYATGFCDIMHPECGCEEMIQLYKDEGRWVEDDNYTPKPADIIMYNWRGRPGPNVGMAQHVGIVQGVANGWITVIEGNKGEAVATRKIPVGYVHTRGFCLPNYASKSTEAKPRRHWAADAMAWAKDKGYMDGTRPDAPLTRGEAATILRRMKEGE